MNRELVDALPPFFWLVLMAALSVCFAVLALTRARGGWFAPLASVNCFLIAAESVALTYPELAPWRAQVLVMRLTELPSVTAISALCLAQAGVLAWPRQATIPLGEAAFRPQLRKILVMAPVAMFSAWVLALAGQMIWPVPTFDPFAPMTTRDFLVIAPLCLPAMLYLALLSWLFAKAAGPHAPSVRLRAKNFSLSVGIFAYLLMVVNVVIGYGVQALAPDGARQAITRLQFALEDQLAIVIVLSIPLGLALGTAPAAGDFLFRTAYPAFLKLRDGFEARRWQLASAGKLRRLTRALYHAEGAADFLAMSNGDRAKTIAAVELTAILADPPADAPEITPEKSRRLLTLQRNLLDEETLAKLFSFSSTFNENTVEDRDISADDPFPDALEAALALTQNGREAKGAPERFGQFPWFHLAAVVAENAGIIQAPKTWVSNTESGALTRRRVVRAYFAAQQAATARSG